jgi:hypothetical protein
MILAILKPKWYIAGSGKGTHESKSA